MIFWKCDALCKMVVCAVALLITYALLRWRKLHTFQRGKMNAPIKVYGFPDAWADFDRRHPQWSAVFSRLGEIINMAFTRNQTMREPIEKFVYFFGNLVAEDFNELFLLAANGYGYGAMKLLRSMYEHTIVLKYLHEHPDEIDAFFDFDRVQQRKLMYQVFDIFGRDELPPEAIAKTESRFEEVKERFMIKSCGVKDCTCNHTRVNHTWSKLDFVAMAKQTGEVGKMLVNAYHVPLRHAHPTARSIMERLEMNEGRLGFSREFQTKEADDALRSAHNFVLVALEIQDERFTIPGLKSAVKNSVRDWALIWSPESLEDAASSADEKAP